MPVTGAQTGFVLSQGKYYTDFANLAQERAAAKALNISQPGLSHAIKSLEEEYGVPLFQKEGRNVSLSRYGKELMKDVDEILGAYLRLEPLPRYTNPESDNIRFHPISEDPNRSRYHIFHPKVLLRSPVSSGCK